MTEVPADELLALLAGRRSTGPRSRGGSLAWHDVGTRAVEMLHGLRAAGFEPGARVAFPGRLRPERLAAELGALAGGYVVAADGADVTLVDDGSADGPGVLVAIDGTPGGDALTLERFAARGIAWAASHTALPQPVPLAAADGIRPGDHVLLRGGAPAGLARATLVGAAFAAAELYVGEPATDAVFELDRTGAEVIATDAADVERIASLTAGQRATAARALRRLGRGPLGGRLRLVLVDELPSEPAATALERIGVEVSTAG